jgi:predicted dehydrogenase
MPDVNHVTTSVLMVAIGGYGFHYLKTLLEQFHPSRCHIVGVVDPMAKQSRLWPVVSLLGVPVRPTIEEFYAEGHHADLAVISSPIHHHVPQSIVALERGTSVLCDKPIGATIQEAEELIRARGQSGRWVMIGYQWSFSAAILALKRDILEGRFGRPIRLSTLCCWPRDLSYYGRNDWAGRLRHEATGRWVLDSPANNGMAHYLHNLFFVLGPDMHLSARPRSVQAEMYRANAIESCDTASCRVITDQGVELLFHASHATERTIAPRFRFDFEQAVITCGENNGGGIVAKFRDGREKAYGSPDDTPQFHKLIAALDRVLGAGPIVCGPEAAMSQTLAVNGMHDSVADIPSFPEAMLRREQSPERVYAAGLDEVLLRCYRDGTLPAESGAPWAVAGRTISLADYHQFPGGRP